MRLQQLERNRRTKVKKKLQALTLSICLFATCLRYAYNFRLTFLMFVKKGMHLYIRWAYKQGGGGLISGIISSLANGWAYIRGGGALTWDFTVS